MANQKQSYADNAPGDFFVDRTCIDCDLCRQIAPATFRETSDHSFVWRQPETSEDRMRSLMALVACPTGSIGSRRKEDVRPAIAAFPEPVAENVHFCGFASERTYGASSYLIVRPEGNILVDSPRFAQHLVARLEALGGVALMCLSHIDDVGDHQKFHDHFRCDRIIHGAEGRNMAAERILEGDDPVPVGSDVLAIPTPGHTRGHLAWLYRHKFLFTGDHLAWASSGDRLTAFRGVTWYSWPVQTRSMERLLAYDFEWVLPGHGRRVHLPAPEMARKLRSCVEWMTAIR